MSCLDNVSVYYPQAQNPREVEFKLLMKFVELFNGKSFYKIENFANHLPSANVKIDVSTKHSLTKHTNRNKRTQNRIHKISGGLFRSKKLCSLSSYSTCSLFFVYYLLEKYLSQVRH